MVNQLLDMAKVKSSVDISKWCHGDAAVYIGMTVDTYREFLTIKGIDLIFDSSKKSLFMDFVPEYFDKILRNLLSNAQKHTPEGGSITVSLHSDSSKMTFTVADTGVGISPDDLPHIFEEFYQGDRQHTEAGTGIGLAFVSRMVDNMYGRITARNLPEGGAEFTVTIPLKQKFEVSGATAAIFHPAGKRNATIAATRENDEQIDADTDKPSIIIIEDNADVRFYIGSLLNEQYIVRFACNGEEGIAKAKEFMPDLIVTDLMMPVMDGYDVCRAIRASEILNHIPIIVITAKATDEDRHIALEAGADAYLYKPFNAEELYIRVSKLLEQRRLLREKYSKAIIEGGHEEVDVSDENRIFMSQITSFIYEHIEDTTFNPDMVADKMCMSRTQLDRKISSITGHTISSFILQIRLERAKFFLQNENLPIAEIADKCGFDANYFSRVFKQIYGVSPSKFKKT